MTDQPSHRTLSIRNELRQLLALSEGPWRWSAGVQSLFAMLLAPFILTLAGRESQGLVASMGAFTALYFPQLTTRSRMRIVPFVGLGFVVAALLGIAGASSAFATILVLNLVSVVACVLAFGFKAGPPGPMMFVLVTGVTGHMATPRADGSTAFAPLSIPLLIGMGAVCAYVVVIASHLLHLQGGLHGAGQIAEPIRFSRLDRTSMIIVARVVVAVAIATAISVPFGLGHAYWVIMVAGVVLQVSHSLRFTTIRVIQRVLGTVVGVGAFGLVSQVLPTGIALILTLALLQCVVEVVIARNYGLGLVFITPLSLLIATAGNPDATRAVVTDRVVDTLIGAGIALVVLAASEWFLARDTRRRVRSLGGRALPR